MLGNKCDSDSSSIFVEQTFYCSTEQKKELEDVDVKFKHSAGFSSRTLRRLLVCVERVCVEVGAPL